MAALNQSKGPKITGAAARVNLRFAARLVVACSVIRAHLSMAKRSPGGHRIKPTLKINFSDSVRMTENGELAKVSASYAIIGVAVSLASSDSYSLEYAVTIASMEKIARARS
jgi:hypothetical protein